MKREKAMLLKSDTCVKVDNNIYLICRDINLIYKINLKKNKVFLYDTIPEENIFLKRLCAKIVYWNSELIFIPFNAKKIWILNMLTHKWDSIELKDISSCSGQALFFQAVIFQEHLFVIGSNYPAILNIDLKTRYIKYISEPYAKSNGKNILFRCDYAQKEDCLYLASCIDNEILEFNMRTGEYKWIVVGKKSNKYVGIIWENNYFWIAPKYYNTLVRWNGKCEVMEYELPKEFRREGQEFIGIISYKNGFILKGGINSLSAVIPNREINSIYAIQDGYYFFQNFDKNEYIWMNKYGEIYIESGNVKQNINCQVEKKELNHYLKKIVKDEIEWGFNLFQEDSVIDINMLCKYLKKKGNMNEGIEGKCGNRVWKKLNIE